MRCSRSVLWRQKEQFSDGVGYSWIDKLKDHAETQVRGENVAEQSPCWFFVATPPFVSRQRPSQLRACNVKRVLEESRAPLAI